MKKPKIPKTKQKTQKSPKSQNPQKIAQKMLKIPKMAGLPNKRAWRTGLSAPRASNYKSGPSGPQDFWFVWILKCIFQIVICIRPSGCWALCSQVNSVKGRSWKVNSVGCRKVGWSNVEAHVSNGKLTSFSLRFPCFWDRDLEQRDNLSKRKSLEMKHYDGKMSFNKDRVLPFNSWQMGIWINLQAPLLLEEKRTLVFNPSKWKIDGGVGVVWATHWSVVLRCHIGHFIWLQYFSTFCGSDI